MTYCVHCNTELPEGARYCFKCGKAVYQIQAGSPFRLPAKAGGLSRLRFMDVEPYREEQDAYKEDYLRNTASFVSVDPEAAALVVYGNASMQGENVSLRVDMNSSPQACLKRNVLYANITPRQVKGKTYYVALFPRIYFFTYGKEKADVTHASCELAGLPRRLSGVDIENKELITLYPGLVTEVDWSRIEYRGLYGDRDYKR